MRVLDAGPRPAVSVRGQVEAEVVDCAVGLVRGVLSHHGVPAGDGRIRLTGPGGAASPLLVQVNLRLCGAPARIQVRGEDAAGAIAAAASRLHDQIELLRTDWRARPWPEPGRLPPAPAGSRRIARVKTCRLQVGRPCQAAATMYALDYDVHLYTDAETGQDAVVHRSGPTGLRIARQHSMRPSARMPRAMPLTVNSRPVPVLSTAEAVRRLGDGWLPWLFFTEARSGRGHLCYRRHDGDAGLVRPVPA